MVVQYKLMKNMYDEVCSVFRTVENKTTAIPFDPANTDYQQYLKWLEEGNQPLPAEE